MEEEKIVHPPEGTALPPEQESKIEEHTSEVVNLEKRRDEKCFPVAQKIIEAVASDLIPEDANIQVDYNPITKKILTAYLEADLNIATEMTYVPQLLLNVFSGLNRTVQMCNFLPIDDVRYGGIARKILAILAEGNVPLGNLTQEQNDEAFNPIKEKLSTLFTEEKLTWLEIKYVMDNIFESFKSVMGIVGRSIEDSTALAEAKLFGLETMSDLSLKKLDEIMKQ